MILSDTLFKWREAYGSSNISWHPVSGAGSPVNQVDSPYAAGAGDITALRANAVEVKRGERIRFNVSYNLPGGEPETGLLLQVHGLTGDTYRTVFREVLSSEGDENAVSADFVWPLEDMQFMPIIKTWGSTALEVRGVSVRRVVEWTEKLRSWDSAESTNATMNALAEPGDVAVLAMASQYGNTQARPPEGWESAVTDGGAARAGYIAFKRVNSASDTVGLTPLAGDTSNARKRALLAVYKGIPATVTPRVEGWQEAAFDLPSGFRQVLVSQRHATANAPRGVWAPVGDRIVESGAWSETASWSQMRMGLTNTAHTVAADQSPQMWARVLIPPEPEKSPISVWRDEVERPVRVRRMPEGAKTVEALFAKKGFAIAHRGGSISWPEMSMRAYTQAVAHGADALELSAQRTSDGHWVGVHDRTLKRIDPTAPDTPVTEMTLAEVQRYTTQGEPIVLAQDVLEAYAASHVIFLDPKYSAANWRELEALVPDEHRSRVVWKFFADADWLAAQWRAAGYKTWGYAYREHADDGRLIGWEESWDFLGMEWNAGSEAWGTAMSFGKPVIAHICQSKTEVQTGLSMGAQGCMVAGVSQTLPRTV